MNLIPSVKKSRHFWIVSVIVVFIALCGWMGIAPPHANVLIPPTNPKPLCTAPPALFNSWFDAGVVTLNGSVKPANSITFPNTPNCSFYQWSEQMFLWLTSPTPKNYGGTGGHIFDSPVFFDVSPPDSNGNRHFIPHSTGFINNLAIRVAQVGPHGLQVIFSKAGTLFEIVDPVFSDRGLQLILNSSGKQVEIAKSALVQGKPTFFDVTGVVIDGARPIIPPQFQQIPVVQGFPISGITHFLGISGSEVDVEQGQAGGNSVLMTKTGSLVYYATMVNDVYAYFLTGSKDGLILPKPIHFPTTQTELDKIIAVGAPMGVSFVDSVALAIEVKTSWVEAASLPDPGNYITMVATIPTYNTSNPTNWVVNGQKTVNLAMVGMHVVGSTAGHPEMIWATFEHFENTPNAAFSYVNTSNVTVNVPQNTNGYWLFCDSASTGPFDIEHMFYSASHIIADPTFTVSPSNTLRQKAWGAASDVSPNPLDATSALSNTEIISINNSVRGQLIAGDVRQNYIMGGATWTIGGQIPTGDFPSGNAVGTSKLCNSTLETYQQGANSLFATGIGCFDCHTSTATSDNLADTFVSHIFPTLKPLFGSGGLSVHGGPQTGLGDQFQEQTQPEHLKLFPNPASDIVNAEIIIKKSGNVQIVIGDMNGKILAQRTSNLQTGTNLVAMPVDGLPTGTYFLKVYKQDGSKSLIGSFFKR